jgi:hypothetical protein
MHHLLQEGDELEQLLITIVVKPGQREWSR